MPYVLWMFGVVCRLILIHSGVSLLHRLADVVYFLAKAATNGEMCLARTLRILKQCLTKLFKFLFCRACGNDHELISAYAVNFNVRIL